MLELHLPLHRHEHTVEVELEVDGVEGAQNPLSWHMEYDLGGLVEDHQDEFILDEDQRVDQVLARKHLPLAHHEFVEMLRKCAKRPVCECLSDLDLAGVVFRVDVVFKGRREECERDRRGKVLQPVFSNLASVLVKPPDFKAPFVAHLLRQKEHVVVAVDVEIEFVVRHDPGVLLDFLLRDDLNTEVDELAIVAHVLLAQDDSVAEHIERFEAREGLLLELVAGDEFASGGVPGLELAVSRQHMQALLAPGLVEDRIRLVGNPSQGDPVGV